MAYEAYQQVARPVSRIAEKILGWLSWVLLLLTTIVAMFFGLVLFSNENSIQNIENGIANNQTILTFLANNNLTATQFVITMQNGVWAFIVYLIVCLLISFLALISMKHRVVSGLLFLLVAILTIPLFFILVPLFFVIVAIMMFARKDKITPTTQYYDIPYEKSYNDNDFGKQYERMDAEEKVYVKSTTEERQKRNERAQTRHIDETASNNVFQDADAQSERPVLSRTAKYHHKSSETFETPQKEMSDLQEDDTTMYQSRSEARKYESNHTFDSRANGMDNADEISETYNNDKEVLKQQRKEERAQIKAQKKEARKARKAHEKEQRKLRPSAASQRRQNYDYRKQVQQARAQEDEKKDKQ